jgi:hypothetical protein
MSENHDNKNDEESSEEYHDRESISLIVLDKGSISRTARDMLSKTILPEHISDLNLCFRDLSDALSQGMRSFGMFFVKTFDVNTDCAKELAEDSSNLISAVDLQLENFRREAEFVQMVSMFYGGELYSKIDTMLLHCNAEKESIVRHVRYLIERHALRERANDQIRGMQKRFCVILHMSRDDKNPIPLIYDKSWDINYVDCLVTSGITLSDVLKEPIGNIFRENSGEFIKRVYRRALNRCEFQGEVNIMHELQILTELLNCRSSKIFEDSLAFHIFHQFLDPMIYHEFAHPVRDLTNVYKNHYLPKRGPMIELYTSYIGDIIETCVVEIFCRFYEGRQIELLYSRLENEEFAKLWYSMACSVSITGLSKTVTLKPHRNSVAIVSRSYNCSFPFSLHIFQ